MSDWDLNQALDKYIRAKRLKELTGDVQIQRDIFKELELLEAPDVLDALEGLYRRWINKKIEQERSRS